MNFTGFCACAIVAWDCAEKAVGAQSQSLLATNALWVWWVIAGLWAVSAYRFLVSEC
jgi:hypothetical protein